MVRIMHDDTDVIARSLAPLMINLAKSVQDEFPQEEIEKMDEMIEFLNGWDGRFDEKSISASIYSFTIMNLHKSWFHKLLPGDSQNSNKMLLMENLTFMDYL